MNKSIKFRHYLEVVAQEEHGLSWEAGVDPEGAAAEAGS